jgi:hypothetical protein
MNVGPSNGSVPWPAAGSPGWCRVAADGPERVPEDRRGVLVVGSAEMEGDACPADGRVLGMADVHLLAQRAEQRERVPSDAEMALDEIVDRLLQNVGRAQWERDAYIGRKHGGRAGCVNT